MYALQKVGRAVAPNVIAIQKRNANISVICTKPRIRISFLEKVLHGFVIGSAALAVPIYCAEKVAHGFIFLGIPMILPLFYSTQFKVWAEERNASM